MTKSPIDDATYRSSTVPFIFSMISVLAAWLLLGCASGPVAPAAGGSTSIEVASVAIAAGDSGAASSPEVQGGAQLVVIEGVLNYRARIALPPTALAVVELREVVGVGGRTIAEQHIALDGRQVPISFALEVSALRLADGRDYVVRGGVASDSRPLWTTDSVPLDVAALTASGRLTLGTLWMTAADASSFGTAMQCGGLRIEVAFEDGSMQLRIGARQWSLRQAPSGSGARYVDVVDPATEFWNKGDGGRLTLAGREYPECRPATAGQTVYRAVGNEPGWLLELSHDSATLVSDYGQSRVTLPVTLAEASGQHTRHLDRDGGRRLDIVVHARQCADSMSGMLYPHTVEVRVDGARLSGCGGDPGAAASEIFRP
jgi:uncharacterized membrane protein/uncharacterized lipoprotein YbaY